ncbi:hypothetical protein GEMRC1_009109 [Eukaryota sp. GEM-RC1]
MDSLCHFSVRAASNGPKGSLLQVFLLFSKHPKVNLSFYHNQHQLKKSRRGVSMHIVQHSPKTPPIELSTCTSIYNIISPIRGLRIYKSFQDFLSFSQGDSATARISASFHSPTPFFW